MKFTYLAIAVSAIFFIPNLIFAENLWQIYQQAKTYDPQLKAFEANVRAVQTRVIQAQAELKPQASLSASSTLAMQNISNSSEYSAYSSSNYSLSLSQSLYNKPLQAQTAKAKANAAQSQAELRGRRQDLMVQTAELYFNVLLNQENVTFSQAEKKAIAKQLEQVKAYFEVGLLAITDVKETQSRYDQVEAQVIVANNQLALAKEALVVITGRMYQKFTGIQKMLTLHQPKPNNMETWVQLAQQKNQQLKAAQYAINVTQKNLEQQRATRKPTVELLAKHTGILSRDNAGGSLDRNQNDTSVTIQLNMPLYTSGAIRSKVNDARYNKQRAQYELQLQKQLVTQRVRSAYLTVISDISRAHSLKQALESSKIALESTQAGFEVGTRTAVDVLLSLRNVFAAKRDYATARYNYLLNQLKLKQAAGIITAADLQKTTALLS